MRLVNREDLALKALPVRRECAAARLLAPGDLGAHILHLAQGAAREHLAQVAQDAQAAQDAPGAATFRHFAISPFRNFPEVP